MNVHQIINVSDNYTKYNSKQKKCSNTNFCAKGVYPGSFDPITNGHIDIIKRASKLFDSLTVLVAINPEKKGFLPIHQRVKLIKESIGSLHNVKVESSEGLTSNYAKRTHADFMVRGIRNKEDFDYEKKLNDINKKIEPDINTIFIPANSETEIISSSVVRDVYKLGGNICGMVPQPVSKYLGLKKESIKTFKNIGFDDKTSEELFNNVINVYDTPNRGYHGINHIDRMLNEFEKYENSQSIKVKNPNEFKFAIYMHDYVNGEKNDVLKSIAIADEYLKGIDPQYNTKYVDSLISATDYSKNKRVYTHDQGLMQDIDLSILGAEHDMYQQYSNEIRKQYIKVPDEEYKQGRINVLQSFLDRLYIYETDYYRANYESQARKNISNEIDSLK